MIKYYCKVRTTYNDKILVEIYLEKMETIREFKGHLVEVLKKMGLDKQGAEFYWVETETENGIEVNIEPYVPVMSKEVEEVYRQLAEETFETNP